MIVVWLFLTMPWVCLQFVFMVFPDHTGLLFLMRNSIAANQTDLVLLDFSTAPDKVSHWKLLLKLHRYGVRGSTLKWIQVLLSYQTQTVVIENEMSTLYLSHLGSLKALSLVSFTIKSKVRLFADDTAI